MDGQIGNQPSFTFGVLTILRRLDCQFGWLQGSRKLLIGRIFWLRGPDTYRIDNY